MKKIINSEIYLAGIKLFANKIYLFIFLLVSVEAVSQKSTINLVGKENKNITVYRQCMDLQDYNTALYAVHYLIAEDPVKYSNWRDTLAMLYTTQDAYSQAYLLTEQLLSDKGYSELRLKIKAICSKQLQRPVEAIDAYATLFNKTGNSLYGFEELQLEYAIKRLNESVGTAAKLLQTIPVNDSTKVSIGLLDGKSVQLVSLRAAVNNILGLVFIDLQEKNSAISSFKAALNDNPDFEQAKNNLAVAQALAEKARN